MDYTVLSGRGKGITSDYKVTKLPHLFIINQKGVIHTSDRFLPAEGIRDALNELINKPVDAEQEDNK